MITFQFSSIEAWVARHSELREFDKIKDKWPRRNILSVIDSDGTLMVLPEHPVMYCEVLTLNMRQ